MIFQKISKKTLKITKNKRQKIYNGNKQLFLSN